MAAMPKPSWNVPLPTLLPALRPPATQPVKSSQLLDFSGVFRGHELTRKDRRLSSGLGPIDAILDGGIPRGRISEITGRAGSGKTSIAASFAASATHRGEVAAWLDASGAFDPESMSMAGVELDRMLCVIAAPSRRKFAQVKATEQSSLVKAAEIVLEAGGFGLVVVDFGEAPRSLTQSCAIRIARAAERSGAAVIAIAPWRMCGTFAALSLDVSRAAAAFSRLGPGAPVTFDGLTLDAMVARNKMGGTGDRIRVRALIDTIGFPLEAPQHKDSAPARGGDSPPLLRASRLR